jgi:hypothetical protein
MISKSLNRVMTLMMAIALTTMLLTSVIAHSERAIVSQKNQVKGEIQKKMNVMEEIIKVKLTGGCANGPYCPGPPIVLHSWKGR